MPRKIHLLKSQKNEFLIENLCSVRKTQSFFLNFLEKLEIENFNKLFVFSKLIKIRNFNNMYLNYFH